MRLLRVVCFACLGLACLAMSCGTTDTVEFRSGANTLAKKNVMALDPVWTSWAYLPGELGPVPKTCVDDLHVRLFRSAYHQSKSAELDLFPRDPQTLLALLKGMTSDGIQAGRWSDNLRSPGALGSVVAIPFPPNAQADASQPFDLGLAFGQFWTAAPDLSLPLVKQDTACQPFAGGNPVQRGVVKAFAVYQRGLCGTLVPVDDLLAQIATGLWDNFRTSGNLQNPRQKYTLLAAVVSSNGASGPNDVSLSFLLAFHYSADVALVGNEVWGMYQYEFVLGDDGILRVEHPERVRLASSGIHGGPIAGSLANGLEKDLPARFEAGARAAQTRDLGFLSATQCATSTDCGPSADGLAKLITKDALAAAGLANATDDQVRRVRCAAGHDPACAALGRAGTLAVRWACVPRAGDEADKVCRYVLPAKRLNLFSDEIEMVWFDGPELDKPAFALFVAANPQQKSQLCSAVPHSVAVPPGHFRRVMATAGFGP